MSMTGRCCSTYSRRRFRGRVGSPRRTSAICPSRLARCSSQPSCSRLRASSRRSPSSPAWCGAGRFSGLISGAGWPGRGALTGSTSLVRSSLLPVSLLLAQVISLPLGYSAEQFLLRDGYTFSAGLLPVWVTLLGAAVVEELAWHSYGTDTLIRRMSVFSASMVFTVIWVLWHLPLSFIDGYYHNEVVKSGVLHTLTFPASMIAFVILMNWLYFRCGRSILIPIIFHISANFSAEMFMTDPDSKVIQTGILLILSVVVVIKERRLFFTRPEPEFRAAA